MPQEKKSATKRPSRPVKERTSAPASTPEAREQQLINLAVNLAEKQLADGTASAAVITHYLKRASTREQIEQEMLQEQKKLLQAKTNAITDSKNNENLAKEAIEAMKSYGPSQ